MEIKNITLMVLWLVVIPYIIGKVITVKKEKSGCIYSWLFGHIYEMALFFMIALAYILEMKSFHELTKVYSVSVLCSAAIALIILIVKRKYFYKTIYDFIKSKKGETKLPEEIEKQKKKIKVWPLIYKIVAIALIVFQLFMKIKYTNINNDDASFVVLSKQMIQTDKMYVESNGKLNSRRALAPISAYYATTGEIVKVDSTILTHTVMPILFIIMYYTVCYYFSKKVFKNEEDSWITLIFFIFLSIFTFEYKGVNKYLLLYTWFGRAVTCGIVLPLLWNVALEAMSKEGRIMDWLRFVLVSIAACLGSEMAIPIVGISIGCLTVKSVIEDRKIRYIFLAMFGLIPLAYIGLVYLNIK